MTIIQAQGLSLARPESAGRVHLTQPTVAPAAHVGTGGLIGAFSTDLFMSKWYRNPERPKSLSERLQS